jgi:hypothetical protein
MALWNSANLFNLWAWSILPSFIFNWWIVCGLAGGGVKKEDFPLKCLSVTMYGGSNIESEISSQYWKFVVADPKAISSLHTCVVSWLQITRHKALRGCGTFIYGRVRSVAALFTLSLFRLRWIPLFLSWSVHPRAPDMYHDGHHALIKRTLFVRPTLCLTCHTMP